MQLRNYGAKCLIPEVDFETLKKTSSKIDTTSLLNGVLFRLHKVAEKFSVEHLE